MDAVVIARETSYTVLDAVAAVSALDEVIAIESRFRALAAGLPDAVYWMQVTPTPRLRFVNEATVFLSGLSAEELYADPDLLRRIVHPDDRHLPERVRSGCTARLRWVRRDGSTIWVEQRIAVVSESRGVPSEILVLARDVTHQVDNARDWARHSAQRDAVTTLTVASQSQDSVEVLDSAVSAVMQLVDAQVAAVWWESTPGGDFLLAAGVGFDTISVGSILSSENARHPFRVRANSAVTSYEQDVRISGRPGDRLTVEGVLSGVGVPIRSEGRIVGVLAGYSRKPSRSDPQDELFFQAVAGAIGACADQAALLRLAITGRAGSLRGWNQSDRELEFVECGGQTELR